MIFLYTSAKNIEEAKRTAEILIERKVAGSVSIFPVQTFSHAPTGIKETPEVGIWVKTIDKNVQEVEDIVRAIHSEKIPCVATFMLWRMNREYKEWLITSTS